MLSDLRSASVINDRYAHAAAKAGLNKHILHASSELHKQMTFCLDNFTQSFSGSSYGWPAGVALSKVLADCIESIAGAIYTDSKSNKEIVWQSMASVIAEVEGNGVVHKATSTATTKKTAKKLAARDVLREVKNAMSGLRHSATLPRRELQIGPELQSFLPQTSLLTHGYGRGYVSTPNISNSSAAPGCPASGSLCH